MGGASSGHRKLTLQVPSGMGGAMPKKTDPQEEAAFSLQENDRFHCILCSLPVRFDDKAKAEVILTFFVIRRASGRHTICNVNRTYDSKGACVTRAVQTKDGIPASRIDQEVTAIREAFSKGIEAGSGRKMEWDTLDLSTVASMKEQVARIHAWGRVGVRVAGDIPPIGLN